MLRFDDDARTLDLSVHDLLAEAPGARGPAMSGRARRRMGMELHQRLQGESTLEAEVVLRHVEVVRGWTCTVHGRVDGVGEEDGHTILEEIKSSALPAERLDEVESFGAWERQLALYVCFAEAAKMADPVGRLRVVSLVDGSERIVTLRPDPELRGWLVAWLERRVHLRDHWLAWRSVRRNGAVVFPHEAWREGQVEAARAAEDAVREGGHLMLQAPTGVGKTAAVAYGVIKAAFATDKRVLWTTARTPQQWEIEKTLRAMKGTPLRTVTLRAQSKACGGCAPETCPLAQVEIDIDGIEGMVDADRVEAEAKARGVCPWRLGRMLAEYVADVVIGDQNYGFDPEMHLRACASKDWVVVVDEAHQLPDRAMGWGSPELHADLARAVDLPGPFAQIAAEVEQEIEDAGLRADGPITEPSLPRWRDLRDRIDELALDHAALPLRDDDPWLPFARAVDRFTAALERAGEETVATWDVDVIRLVCRDPSPVLTPRFDEYHASVSLSATLHPDWFYRDRCGLDPSRTRSLRIASPFPPDNRLVLAVRGVSTAYKHRGRDRDKVLAQLEACAAAVPGNVAIFFGSFEQLRDLFEALDLPGRERLMQRPDLDEAGRAELLAALREPGPPKVMAAVLGGAFGEGVDLPNGALQAAIIVGPALPPPSIERQLIQAWYEDRFDQGFDLAFVHPGMTRVVQAAGRVVRGPEERGAVVLLCQRFVRYQYGSFLPEEWTPRATNRPAELLGEFFGRNRD